MDCKTAVCIIFACLLGHAYGNYVEGYCWREFTGSIPSDALKAGVNSRGKSVYISQILIGNKLVPGRIFESTNRDQFAVNGTVKILCSENPSSFEWVKTRIDQVWEIRNRNFFEGGYQKGYKSYIARSTEDGEIMIAEVICSDKGCNEPVTHPHSSPTYQEQFDILTYKEPVSNKGSANTSGTVKLLFVTYFFLVLVKW